MGSLDDAIREHLELKRQRGASDEEVKRQEDEAFGRGRRAAPEEAPVAEEIGEGPEAAEVPAAAEIQPDHLEAAEPQSNGQPVLPPEPAASIEVEEEAFDPDAAEPDEVPADESLHDEVPSEPDRESGPASDPLEETPEFLEGSPEEDRLWFEQRPPKDFDF